MNIQIITAPEHWAAYLINNDASGLDEDEAATIDRWRRREGIRSVLDVADESRLTWFYRLYHPEAPDGVNCGSVTDYTCEMMA